MLPAPSLAPLSDTPAEGTEAAARMASLRQALRAADMIAGKTTEELSRPVEVTAVWPALPPATRRCFAARSERLANAAEGGLQTFGFGPISEAAAERLREELRDGLAHVASLFDQR